MARGCVEANEGCRYAVAAGALFSEGLGAVGGSGGAWEWDADTSCEAGSMETSRLRGTGRVEMDI